MFIDPSDSRPIFMQIKEGLEDAILTGTYEEESQVPSTTELSNHFQINPATALKGINELVNEEILYKKRGIGVFVKTGAVDIIRKKRQGSFKEDYLLPLLKEAKRLDIDNETVIKLIEETNSEENL